MNKKIKIWILTFLITLFVLSGILGFTLNIEHVGNKTVEPHGPLDIILNNFQANAFIASGFFSLGLGSIVYLFINGGIIGSSINGALMREMSITDILISIVPHGIVEIPAMLLSSLIGFQVVEYILIYFFSSYNFKNTLSEFIRKLFFRVGIVILLTFLAGLIEWYITFMFF